MKSLSIIVWNYSKPAKKGADKGQKTGEPG
jgi:hypothetical protein